MVLSDNIVIHRAASLQELDDMLKEYDMKRDSVEINQDALQWSHHAVWESTVHGNRNQDTHWNNYGLDSEPTIARKRPRHMKSKQNDVLACSSGHSASPIPHATR